LKEPNPLPHALFANLFGNLCVTLDSTTAVGERQASGDRFKALMEAFQFLSFFSFSFHVVVQKLKMAPPEGDLEDLVFT